MNELFGFGLAAFLGVVVGIIGAEYTSLPAVWLYSVSFVVTYVSLVTIPQYTGRPKSLINE